MINPAYGQVFLKYFVPAFLILMIMLGRIGILKAVLFFVHAISQTVEKIADILGDSVEARIADINSQQMVFFTRGDNLATLNQAVLYVRRNEHTDRIKVVIVGQDESLVPERLESDLEFLDEAYPRVDIDFVFVHGHFWARTDREAVSGVGHPDQLHVHRCAG